MTAVPYGNLPGQEEGALQETVAMPSVGRGLDPAAGMSPSLLFGV